MITIMNKKGGVGKTSLAFNIAKDLDYYLVSNDDSVIEEVYEGMAKVMEKIKLLSSSDVVYDLGGFIDKNTIPIIKKSDLICIPTLLDINSIKRTYNTVKDVQKLNKKIIIIINNVTKKNLIKYDVSLRKLAELDLEMFVIPESEAIPNSMFLGETITEQYNKGGLSRSSLKSVYKSYSKLLKRIKNV